MFLSSWLLYHGFKSLRNKISVHLATLVLGSRLWTESPRDELMCWVAPSNGIFSARFLIIYTTIAALSAKSVLKMWRISTRRSQFDSDHRVHFSTPTSCQSATFVRPLFAFVFCFLRQKMIKKPQMRWKRIDRRNRSIAQRIRWSQPSTAD